LSLKIGIQSVNPLQGDENLSKATIDFITKYINNHFSNLSGRELNEFVAITFDSLSKGDRGQSITDYMNSINLSESNISVYDSVLDLSMRPLAFISRYRLIRSNIKYYTWMALNDERTSQEHRELSGKTFALLPEYQTKDFPYIDNYPGSEHLCRCYMDPVFNDK